MRSSLRTTLTAAILPAALLATACGSSPMEPAAAQPSNASGYTVAWEKKQAQPQNASGYTVAWGQKAQPQNASGYTVAWGKKAEPQNLSGYTVAW
jgi:hypothetical protein